MHNPKTVKDIMMDVFDYPHLPYWFSIRQAMEIIQRAFLEQGKISQLPAILIFDEVYSLRGIVTLRCIIRALEPKLFSAESINAYEDVDIDKILSNYDEASFVTTAKNLLEKQVYDIMIPSKIYVSPDDTIIKASLILLYQNIRVLPVLDNDKKLVGVVNLYDIYRDISETVLQ